MFSFLPPGITYMFEGLIKRGLFTLTAFFCLTYLASVFNQPIFGMMIAILWITTVFDAFSIRRRINAGYDVPDTIDDVTSFIARNKFLVVILCMFVVFPILVSGVNSFLISLFGFRFMSAFKSLILPGFILLLGIYFLTRSNKSKDDDQNRMQ